MNTEKPIRPPKRTPLCISNVITMNGYYAQQCWVSHTLISLQVLVMMGGNLHAAGRLAWLGLAGRETGRDRGN